MLSQIREWWFLLDWVNIIAPSMTLYAHLTRSYAHSGWPRYMNYTNGLVVGGAIVMFVSSMYGDAPMRVMALASILYAYSITLFIWISDVLMSGGAVYLTAKRGSKWVKELDYIYLALGAVGVFGSLSRVEGLTGRFTKADILGPLFLATALVLRFIKTRAELGGWNSPPGTNVST